MKKKIIVGLVSSMLLTTFTPLLGTVVQAEESLEDLIEQKENVENRSNELGSVIEETDAEMNKLEEERQELEANIQELQITIQRLTEDLDRQNQRLDETNEEIERLNVEIEELNKAIAQRHEKLMTQARATQTKWNPTNVIHMIISAEDISDLISRVGIVSKLVSANQQIIEDQRRDQEAVVKAEAQVQLEKTEVETLVTQIEANREELTVQQVELDNEIMYVAERYQMNSAEKDQFVSEQFELAQKTMALSSEIQAEEERIAEEARIAEEKRLEEERLAEEKRLEEERLAEEKRLEEERIAEEKAIAKAAEEERQRQAEEEAAALAAEQRREEEAQKEQEQKSLAAERKAAEQRRAEEAQQSEQRSAEAKRAEEKRQEAERQARQEAERVAQAEAKARAEANAKAQAAAAQAAADRREAERKAAAAKAAEEAATSSNNSTPASSGWLRPASGYISSPYGWRVHPIFGDRRFHTGVDIAGSGPIIATRAGTVTTAGYSSALGYYVRVNHGDGYTSVYSHLRPNLSVSRGQKVSQGQQLGIMGTTGDSTGVHLDFKIYKNGSHVNPMNYIR